MNCHLAVWDKWSVLYRSSEYTVILGEQQSSGKRFMFRCTKRAENSRNQYQPSNNASLKSENLHVKLKEHIQHVDILGLQILLGKRRDLRYENFRLRGRQVWV